MIKIPNKVKQIKEIYLTKTDKICYINVAKENE